MQRHDIENTVRVHFLSGLADHWRESYVCETGKSMKAAELRGLSGIVGVKSPLHQQPGQPFVKLSSLAFFRQKVTYLRKWRMLSRSLLKLFDARSPRAFPLPSTSPKPELCI